MLFGFSGCSTDSDNGSDDEKIPGAVEYSKVADVSAVGGNGMVKLNWTNPSASDFYGTEITFTPAVAGVNQPIIVTGVSSAESVHIVQGLANGTEYTFFLTALYKSSASTIKGTPNGDGFSKDDETVDVPGTPTISVDDKVPPASVTGLSTESLSHAVRLAWTDPADTDLFGIEIAWKKTADAAAGRSIAPMSAGTVFVAPGTQRAQILELDGGTEYTFTVTAMDTSGNKNSGTEISATPEAFIDIDNAGNISLANVADGIMILIDIPSDLEHVGQVVINRCEYGNTNFKPAGSHKKNSGKDLIGTVNFTDYYVEPEGVYSYRVDYQTVQGDSLRYSEIDSLTAKNGCGLLKYEEPLTLNFDASTFEFSYEGKDSLVNLRKDKEFNEGVNFSIGQKNEDGTMSGKVSLTFNKTSGYTLVQFRDLNAFDNELVQSGVATNVAFSDGDDYYRWKSVSMDWKCGKGFTDGTITFNENDVPLRVEHAADGEKFYVDLSKASYVDNINRVRFETVRRYDSSIAYFSNRDNSRPLEYKTFEYTDKYVEAGTKYKFVATFDQRIDSSNKQMLKVEICDTPVAGLGEPNFADDLKIEYDEMTGDTWLSAKEDEMLKIGGMPHEISVTTDGSEQTFTRTRRPDFYQRIMDTYGLYSDVNVTYSPLGDGTYFANLLYRLTSRTGNNVILGKSLYPFRSQFKCYYYKDESDYQVDYYIADSKVEHVKGLPEPFVVNDNFSGKTFTVANPDGENVYGAKTVTFDSYTEKSSTIPCTVLYNDETKRDGKLVLSNNYISINGLQYRYKLSDSTIELTYMNPSFEVERIELTSASESINVDNNCYIWAEVFPNSKTEAMPVNWTSDNEKIAKISKIGWEVGGYNYCYVNALSAGTVTITAEAGGKTDSVTIEVIDDVSGSGSEKPSGDSSAGAGSGSSETV